MITMWSGGDQQVPFALACALATNDLLGDLLIEFGAIFAEPQGLPPQRDCDHRIHLLLGTTLIIIEELAVMVQKSKHLVVFTGAGISTSSGIPDFRGPKGVWTLQRAGKGVPNASLPFHRAVPSLTHMALVELERTGLLKFVISQNVDSLHLRSGLPREKLAELHGNSFKEICPCCKTEYLRDFEIETIGLKDTPRRCSDKSCGARLKDTVLDWEDVLPPEEMNSAKEHCRSADLVLCLGTSLQITPACNMPLMSIKNGGRVAIVNLQATPKDKKASLVIHGLVDKVIAGVMSKLNLRIPPYIRTDFVQITLRHSLKKKCVRWTLRVTSIHGLRAPLPFLQSIKVSFPERPDMKPVVLKEQPFSLQRETSMNRSFFMLLTLNFTDGCSCLSSSIGWPVDFLDDLPLLYTVPNEMEFDINVLAAAV
ncbi:hypothetical protein U9M48_031110 [Paspalum notatum var. saurae]|uniref:NAD-dependent protein deacetylase SRT1 n=1 Tax=Paspalum notatum var. saurae TaxID=547442 RepID=A0AAQ3U209_PASNO